MSENDELTDVRPIMRASYAALDGVAARVFRYLGLHPGDAFGVAACAALADVSDSEVKRSLERLSGVHLLQRVRSGRYRLHDLLRLYARECFDAEEPPEREAWALRRLIAWYARSGDNALRLALPNFREVALPRGEEPDRPLTFDSTESASAWFEEERANLVDTLEAASAHGLYDLAWRLPAMLYPLFEIHSHWEDWRRTTRTGVAAARAAGDTYGAARNHLGLADACWLLGRIDEARQQYQAATEANATANDAWVEGFALRQLGHITWTEDRDIGAVDLLERAIGVFRGMGERRGEGMSLLSLAECRQGTGELEAALEHCRTAVGILGAIDDTWSVAWGRCFLGSVLNSLGDPGRALAEYQAASDVFREVGDHLNEAKALAGMGESHEAAGVPDSAVTAYRAALDSFRAVDDPRVAEMEGRIARLTGEP